MKDPEETKPEGLNWFFTGFKKNSLKQEMHSCGHLQQTVAAHGSVAGPVTFICGPVPEAVAPLFNHVEALCVPNVRLQPFVLPLAAVELQQQVAVPPPGFAAFAFCLFLLLCASLVAFFLLGTEMSQRKRKQMKEDASCVG